MAQRLHVFFDTTEVSGFTGKAPSHRLGRIADSHLHEVAGMIGARLYVPDLVVTEVIGQRCRSVEKQLASLTAAVTTLKPYLQVTHDPKPTHEAMAALLRGEVESELARLNVTVIQASTLVSLQDVLSLSTQRVAPFKDDHDPRGFHDAVILLGTLRFAQQQGLAECMFVSNDPDHSESVVTRLAKEHGVVCHLVSHTDTAIQMMADLHTARVMSFLDSMAKLTSVYMNEHRSLVQTFLDKHPLKFGDFSPAEGYYSPVDVLSVSIGDIHALPTSPPEEGHTSQIKIHTVAVGEFAVDEFALMPSPIGPLPVLPGTTLGVPTASSSGYVNPLSGIGQTVRIVKRLEVPLQGVATARFADGKFVGEPIIMSLEPGQTLATLARLPAV